MKKNIIFTGGGSGGHVVPALTLISKLEKDSDFSIYYIGGRSGIERSLVKNHKYYPIFTGKLRRYFSLENFVDVFRLGLGCTQAFLIMLRFRKKNSLIFSTGGFVSVPVVFAAWLTRKKIFIHEQTSRVGLANKICSKFASKVLVSFEDSLRFFPQKISEYVGYPLRDECFSSHVGPLVLNGIDLSKQSTPILFVTGGGNGAKLINDLIKDNLDGLKKEFIVVHQVGKIFIDQYKNLADERYIPLAFISSEMIDLYKKAKVVISRAGAGTVCELLGLNKKSIYIPLKIAQKNEQFHNAMEAHKKLGSIIIEEDDLSQTSLFENISTIEINDLKDQDVSNNPTHRIIEIIKGAF